MLYPCVKNVAAVVRVVRWPVYPLEGFIVTIEGNDLEQLRYAKQLLENPTMAARVINLLGSPIEMAFKLLPGGWYRFVDSSMVAALKLSVGSAVSTLGDKPEKRSSDTFHQGLVVVSGSIGGLGGLPALVVELPVSTTIMVRSIADIARSEGHSIADPEVKRACLEVFAFGGPSKSDDGTDTGYFAVRSALARVVNEAAEHVAAKGLAKTSAPALVKIISNVSSRLGVQLTEKVLLQSIPIIGALGGALINTLFISHFQTMARGHFMVLRLEKKYGKEAVQSRYKMI